MIDLPTIPLQELSNDIEDKNNLEKSVKEWISKNLIENPPEYYVKTAVRALIEEDLI